MIFHPCRPGGLRAFILSLVAFACQVSTAFATPAAPTFKRGVNISHWLSQNFDAKPYAAAWFDREDVEWIAQQGFDHIRFPIDGPLWVAPDGTLDDARIEPFIKALAWTKEFGLGAILDMHSLPGASFNPLAPEATVFSDPRQLAHAESIWRQVATRFANEGEYLRFELLNEPVAPENRQLNLFNRTLLAAVRESNPTRIVYITSNRWSSFDTVDDIEVPADPAVAITLHFYNPMIFTHQRANWVKFPADMPPVAFPGTVPDLHGYIPTDHWEFGRSGKTLTIDDVNQPFAKLAVWAAAHAAGREIHIGEFGAYDTADAASRRNYITAVRTAAADRGWGWAVWDYQGGFAIRDKAGQPTAVLEGLFPSASAKNSAAGKK